jgi:Yip1-like protein
MALVDRVKQICLAPKTEWPVIAVEHTPPADLVTSYVLPLAAIGSVAGFIGGSMIGRTIPFIGTYRVPLVAGLGLAIFTFIMAIVSVLVISLIINALAPSFGGEKNTAQAFKVAVYSYTPAWVAGVLQILPFLGILAIFAALYGIYLLYLGLPRLMKCPDDKAIGYTVVVVICGIIVFTCVSFVGAGIAGIGMISSGALAGLTGAPQTRSGSEAEFDKNSPVGKLQELGKKMDESSKKLDAAEKKGDQSAQIAAAVEGLGTLLGGGKRVDPVGIDQLKPFVPETFAGLPKTNSNAEKNGIAGFMVSKAEATYGNGADKRVTLQISDSGGVSGLVALAGWAGVQGEKDDDYGSERTQKVGGRLVHEKVSKRGGDNEFAIVLGDRFVVSAEGRGIGLDELKAAVSDLDLAKIEGMKDVGVQK